MDVKKLERDFKTRGIDFSKPGFYNHPRFLAAEQCDPSYLDRYGRYVVGRSYDDAYLVRAREVIGKAAHYIYDELKKDGRQHACGDATMVLTSILEREGIWSVPMTGAARVEFPEGSGLNTRRFPRIVEDPRATTMGHAWLIAPPFKVVDVTIDLQGWRAAEAQYMSGPVLAEQTTASTYTVDDLVDKVAQVMFVREHRRQPAIADVDEGGLPERVRAYGCFAVLAGRAKVTYISCAPSVTDLPLENMGNLILCGKSPKALFEEYMRL